MDPQDPEAVPSRPHEASPDNRFERLDVPVPLAPPTRRRPSVVTTAGVVLGVSGFLNVLFAVAFATEGNTKWLFVAFGAVQMLSAVLVFLLSPPGRPLGIAMAAVGLVVGIVLSTGDALSGLVTIALDGFVIYALASNGQAFRRG